MRILDNITKSSAFKLCTNQCHSRRVCGYNVNYMAPNTPNFQGLDAVIFDVDGTMVRTGIYHDIAWFLLCAKHPPKNFLDVLMNFPKGTTKEIVKQIYKNSSPEEVNAYVREKREMFFRLIRRNLREVKGLRQFVNSLQGIKKGIASCASPDSISLYLERINLQDQFNPQCIIDASKVKKGKPDPEAYLKALGAVGVQPENCVAFEDSSEGIESALGAGLKVIGVATSRSKEDLIRYGASLAIKDFTEIDLSKVKTLVE